MSQTQNQKKDYSPNKAMEEALNKAFTCNKSVKDAPKSKKQ